MQDKLPTSFFFKLTIKSRLTKIREKSHSLVENGRLDVSPCTRNRDKLRHENIYFLVKQGDDVREKAK